MPSPVETVLDQIELPFELRDYQAEDINRHALDYSCGLWLGLGLGKTVEATLIGCYKLIEGGFDHVVVLCPASLVHQWVKFLREIGLDTVDYRGSPTVRNKLDMSSDFIVMSYQVFQKDYDLLKAMNSYYIVDEAVLLCNTSNLTYKMLNGGSRKLPQKKGTIGVPRTIVTYDRIHKGVCLLSATPINKPTDAFGLINIITPGVYRNYTQFERIHVEDFDFFGQPTAYMELDLLKENLLLQSTQRVPEDHLDLPDIIYKVIEYELHGEEPGYVDIPIWHTHNITNIGDEDLFTFFWTNELYDPDDPDTYFEKV